MLNYQHLYGVTTARVNKREPVLKCTEKANLITKCNCITPTSDKHYKECMYQIKDQKMLKISQQYNCMHCCKKWLVVLTTEWLPWLQTSWGDSGYVMFILILEANCISNLNQNHTLQLTTLERLWESQQLHFKHMTLLWCSVVTISARSCVGYWMLFDTSRCDPFTDVQWLLTARCWL